MASTYYAYYGICWNCGKKDERIEKRLGQIWYKGNPWTNSSDRMCCHCGKAIIVKIVHLKTGYRPVYEHHNAWQHDNPPTNENEWFDFINDDRIRIITSRGNLLSKISLMTNLTRYMKETSASKFVPLFSSDCKCVIRRTKCTCDTQRAIDVHVGQPRNSSLKQIDLLNILDKNWQFYLNADTHEYFKYVDLTNMHRCSTAEEQKDLLLKYPNITIFGELIDIVKYTSRE